MQVTQTLSDGLKREYRIVVPSDEVEKEISSRLDELGRTIRLPGFRPGKVPPQLLRRRYGTAVRGEVLESTLQGSTAEAIRDQNLRPAMPPKVDIVAFDEGADLEYRMSIELLPEIPEPNFGGLGLERLVVDIPDEQVDRAIERIAEQQRQSEPAARPAENGDIVVVDLEGRVDGEEIPGASGKDRHLVLGAGSSLPGFDEQLIGAVAHEHRTLRLTFPADYGGADFAGKEAIFEVEVKEVRERAPLVIDDALAEAVGLETLAELRQEIQQRLQRDYAAAARLRLKRALLDKLAERSDFPVPPGMVEIEFEAIWAEHQAASQQEAAPAADQSVQAEAPADPPARAEAPADEPVQAEAPADPPAQAEPADEPVQAEAPADPPPAQAEPAGGGTAEAETGAAAISAAEEATRAEYRKIAERRVRLGLLLAEVGRTNNITVTQEELNEAMIREARRYVGQERRVLDFYRQHPEATAQLRAPIFEDKVVDFIVELAKPGERHVTPQELFAMPGADGPEPEGENAAVVNEPG